MNQEDYDRQSYIDQKVHNLRVIREKLKDQYREYIEHDEYKYGKNITSGNTKLLALFIDLVDEVIDIKADQQHRHEKSHLKN